MWRRVPQHCSASRGSHMLLGSSCSLLFCRFFPHFHHACPGGCCSILRTVRPISTWPNCTTKFGIYGHCSIPSLSANQRHFRALCLGGRWGDPWRNTEMKRTAPDLKLEKKAQWKMSVICRQRGSCGREGWRLQHPRCGASEPKQGGRHFMVSLTLHPTLFPTDLQKIKLHKPSPETNMCSCLWVSLPWVRVRLIFRLKNKHQCYMLFTVAVTLNQHFPVLLHMVNSYMGSTYIPAYPHLSHDQKIRWSFVTTCSYLDTDWDPCDLLGWPGNAWWKELPPLVLSESKAIRRSEADRLELWSLQRLIVRPVAGGETRKVSRITRPWLGSSTNTGGDDGGGGR